MSKKRWSEEVAKVVVERFKKSKDIEEFLRSVSDQVSWFGRFSKWPRYYFTEKVIEEMKNIQIIFSEGEENVQSRRKTKAKRSI